MFVHSTLFISVNTFSCSCKLAGNSFFACFFPPNLPSHLSVASVRQMLHELFFFSAKMSSLVESFLFSFLASLSLFLTIFQSSYLILIFDLNPGTLLITLSSLLDVLTNYERCQQETQFHFLELHFILRLS